jgi:tRNA threonylcarbamoyladenosine biosynthesis protein TsaB
MTRFLAFDTSTDVMSVALTDGVQVWQHSGPGGAKASTTLIPAVMALLAEAGLTLDALDAIAFGQGPGSFTGLRTACAVAQGLAFGAGQGRSVLVLPIPTLWALAEEARFQLAAQGVAAPRITALLDARMDEMYVQGVDALMGADLGGGVQMIRPEHLVVTPQDVLAGNVFSVYAQRLPDLAGLRCVDALPTATAMLRLAPALAARGHCVPADQALPLYVRNKVAQTTVERAQVKADKLAAAALAPV